MSERPNFSVHYPPPGDLAGADRYVQSTYQAGSDCIPASWKSSGKNGREAVHIASTPLMFGPRFRKANMIRYLRVIRDARCEIRDARCGVRDRRSEPRESISEMLDSRCEIRDPSSEIRGANFEIRDPRDSRCEIRDSRSEIRNLRSEIAEIRD